jgi:hypothetical protein
MDSSKKYRLCEMAKIYKHALMQFCPLHINLDDDPGLHIKDDDPKKEWNKNQPRAWLNP